MNFISSGDLKNAQSLGNKINDDTDIEWYETLFLYFTARVSGSIRKRSLFFVIVYFQLIYQGLLLNCFIS